MNTNFLPNLTSSRVKLNRKCTVNYNDVILFKADVNYVEILFLSGRRLKIPKTMKEVEKRFITNTSFFRTHKSYMVNLDHVVSYQLNDGMTVRLVNDEIACLSRRRKDDFLQNYLKVNS